jgi:hypothetical protein
MKPLTVEKRKELVNALRQKADTGFVRVPICGEAADEIELLAAAVEIWEGRAEAYLKIAKEEAEISRLRKTNHR